MSTTTASLVATHEVATFVPQLDAILDADGVEVAPFEPARYEIAGREVSDLFTLPCLHGLEGDRKASAVLAEIAAAGYDIRPALAAWARADFRQIGLTAI